MASLLVKVETVVVVGVYAATNHCEFDVTECTWVVVWVGADCTTEAVSIVNSGTDSEATVFYGMTAIHVVEFVDFMTLACFSTMANAVPCPVSAHGPILVSTVDVADDTIVVSMEGVSMLSFEMCPGSD